MSFTLEGCRNPSVDLEATNFICANGDYTTGNLGKTWNELDLVPHRLTTQLGSQAAATTTFKVAIVADHMENGRPGYDVLSAPAVGSGSHASCQIDPGTEKDDLTNFGGIDQSLYRILTITQDKGTKCILNYVQRLAVGSHAWPGSSLHSNLANQSFGTAGVGSKEVSIPVREISPQTISKDMAASQDSEHLWNLTKGASPVELRFADTCGVGDGARSQQVDITVEWEKLAASPSGDIDIVTNVYATNPALRSVIVNVTDEIYAGAALIDTKVFAPVDVPANTSNFLIGTHQTTAPAGSTDLHDVATATYTDPDLPKPIEGTTEATASVDVIDSGDTLNESAVITDVEWITGDHLSFSVDSVSGASGSFNPDYTLGTETTGSVTWVSDSQTSSGSVTFHKTVYVDEPAITSGTLSDEASLEGSDGLVREASLDVDIESSAEVELTIEKTIPLVLDADDAEQTFTFDVTGPNGYSSSPTITFGPGEGGSLSPKSVVLTGLAPGQYDVVEQTLAPYSPQPPQSETITLPSCDGAVSFDNQFAPATARVRKVTIPAGGEVGWEFTLLGPNTGPDGESVETTGTDFIDFATELVEGSYTITETARPGWDLTDASSECSFTVDYPADADRLFQCTYTNTQRGRASVIKTQGSPNNPEPGDGFDFEIRDGASPNEDGTVVESGTTDAFGDIDFGDLVPGDYQLCETGILPGWESSLSAEPGAFVPNSDDPNHDNSVVCVPFTLDPGEDEVFRVHNTPPPDGDARTIGFWRNWSSCTNGNQAPVLDDTLGAGIWSGNLWVDTCQEAVAILSKSDVASGKKRASDAAYGMASQLLATELNLRAGAGSCPGLSDDIAAAQALLQKHNFTGTGAYLEPGKGKKAADPDRAVALQLAATFDAYNNNTLC